MALSRRPIVEARGGTWLGDPDAHGFSIELTDEAIVMTAPSGVSVVPWTDVVALDVDIPTAPWWLARSTYWVLSTTDAFEGASSQGAHSGTSMRRGNSDITVRVTRSDGTEVTGWAAKHQVLGYPVAEATAAAAIVRGRAGRGPRTD